jgi:hypothetical protein
MTATVTHSLHDLEHQLQRKEPIGDARLNIRGQHAPPGPSTQNKQEGWNMSAHRTLIDDRPTVYTGGNRNATGSRELRRDLSDRLDRSSQQVAISASARPNLGDSPPGMENVRSAAGVVAARLLSVLLVAMVVISILGLTVFDRQGGYSTTAIVSVAIGNSAAALGMILGFLKAYLAS